MSQSELGSNGNEGVLNIPQSSSTGALPLDGLVSNPGHLMGWRSYLSAETELA